MAVASTAGADGKLRPPASIEDFLWNLHTCLAENGPLPVDQLRETYAQQLGHKFVIERFLVVGDGGLQATLKRIPHVATVFVDGDVVSVKAALALDLTKEGLVQADQNFRAELQRKNAVARAKAKAKTPAAKASNGAPPEQVSEQPAAAVAAEAPSAKRPPPAATPESAADPKKARTEARPDDAETEKLAKMLVQGVVRVLQNRVKENKGPLPVSELEDEFKKLWKVPFNLQQAGETDAVEFLRKWSNKVDVTFDGSVHMISLSKKPAGEKAKAGVTGKSAAPAASAEAAGVVTKASSKAATVVRPGAPTPAPPPAKSGAPAAEPDAEPAAGAAPATGSASVPKAVTPSRPPTVIEDFLFNLVTVLDAVGAPLPVDSLREVYSQRMGHKCAIERFLVVGEGGLSATLKRIPHVVNVFQDAAGTLMLKSALPSGCTRAQLQEADQSYRKELSRKAAEQKNAAAQVKAGANGAPSTDKAAAAAAPPAAAQASRRPASGPAEGEEAAKKAKAAPEAKTADEKETLARMLVQGIVRVLQNRVKEGKGPLPVDDLEREFKELWKVPFNLSQAGETDCVAFLAKYPNKVEVRHDGTRNLVSLAKRGAAAAAKAPAESIAAGEANERAGSTVPATAEAGSARSSQLAEARAQASTMLASMREMVRQQESLVAALDALADDPK